MTFKKVFLNI